MSNFREITLNCLIEAIELIRAISEKKDQSSWNTALTFFHLGRDQTLSQEKRGQLTDLINELKKLLEPEDNQNTSDSDLLVLIQATFKQHRKKLTDLSLQSKPTDGTTGDALLNIEQLAQLIYEKMQSVNCLDMKHDKTNPLSYLQYYAMKFFAKNVYNKYMRDYIFEKIQLESLLSTQYIEHFLTNQQLDLAKENRVLEAIAQCQKEILGMKPNHPTFKQLRLGSVMRGLQYLKEESVRINAIHAVYLNQLAHCHLWTDYLQQYIGELEAELTLSSLDESMNEGFAFLSKV